MNVQQNAPLAPYTSLRVGGPAENLVELSSQELSQSFSQFAKPLWILGGGTNSLISDKGLSGTVIVLKGDRIERVSPTRLKVDSATEWDKVVQETIRLNLYGLEFTSGVPGSTGAAVVGGIAAYGHRIANQLVEATILNLADGSTSIWQNSDFGFDYRTSNLQKPEHKDLVVLDATFEFSQTPTGELEYNSALKVAQELGLKADSLTNRRTIILETRKRAGSLLTNNSQGPWTAGSFFKNPVVNQEQVEAIVSHDETTVTKEELMRQNQVHSGNAVRVSAAHVLLAAGFKRGQTWGQVRLHPDHILKIENVGQASAQDIYAVVQEIVTTVKAKLNIQLEPEVRFLGEF